MQFASDLDEDTKNRIESGRKYVELLKQTQGNPTPFFLQAVAIYAANNGIFANASVEKTREIEDAFLSYLQRDHKEMLSAIESGRELTDEIVAKLDAAIASFKESHQMLYV